MKAKKVCSACGGPGPFFKEKKNKDGLSGQCKVCKSSWQKKNPEKAAANSARWYKKNGDRLRPVFRARRRQTLYGLDEEAFEILFRKQKGRCACCGDPLKRTKRGLHIDHDHKKNRVRALLCGGCNTGLGQFKDSIKRLLCAVTYLRRFL